MSNFPFSGSVPLEGTEIAAHWDALYHFLMGLSTFFFILVVGGMIYFIIKYRHRPGIKTKYFTHSTALEVVTVGIPTLLLMGIFTWGYAIYHEMRQAPGDAYEIHVIGKQWLWQFQYDNGRSTVGELYVPLNRPVKLIMTSQDVIHDFFIPSFRIKQDVVPGMYTTLWFEATVPGKHQVFCSMYCGTAHSSMLAKLIVLNDQQWKDWNDGKKLGPIPDAGEELAPQLASATPEETLEQKPGVKTISLVEQGKALTELKGCVACHTADGTPKVGPTFKGVYGSKVPLSDGSVVLADDNYIRESIEKPAAKIVKGFNPIMPTFKGLVSESEMNALIAYIKSLK